MKASEARQNWKSVLNRAAMGETIVIERGGVTFFLMRENRREESDEGEPAKAADTGIPPFSADLSRMTFGEIVLQIKMTELKLSELDTETQDPDQIHKGETLHQWLKLLRSERDKRKSA